MSPQLVAPPPKLADLGISKDQSSRWQRIADVPEDAFEGYINHAKTDDKADITAVGLTQHAARQRTPQPVGEPIPPREGRYRVIVIDPPWPMKKIERAERKAGEMLREREPHQGGRPAAETGNKPLPVSAPPKLDDLGISKMQSSRWQKIADVPEAG